LYDLLYGDTAMILPQSYLLTQERKTEVSDCRDAAWHPKFPLLASVSFDAYVRVWTL
jgi:hypothetical protein